MDSPSGLETRYKAAQHHSSQPASAEHSFGSTPLTPPLSRRRGKTRAVAAFLKRYKKWLMIAAAVALVIIAVQFTTKFFTASVPGVNKNYYQAVFLTDGTQYVGQLVPLDASHYKLVNAYFITANQSPVVSDQGSQATNTSQVALVKLETGLLNAENEMTIPKDKILFYENLKPDGQAAKLLNEDKQKSK